MTTMKKAVNDVRRFCQKAGQKTPDQLETPSDADRLLRARLIVEEALEQVNRGWGVMVKMNGLPIELKNLKFEINQPYNVVEVADGAADMWYVGVAGSAVVAGFDLEPVVMEVTRSNMSKFIDGYEDPSTGKWIKGPSYSPADITPKLGPIVKLVAFDADENSYTAEVVVDEVE